MCNQNLFQDRTATTTVRTHANKLAMQQAVEHNSQTDALDRQLSIRWNPVLRENQRETARKIIKVDLGHGPYAVRKVCTFFVDATKFADLIKKKRLKRLSVIGILIIKKCILFTKLV